MFQIEHFTNFFLNSKSNVLVKRVLFLLNAALAIAVEYLVINPIVVKGVLFKLFTLR